MLAALGEKLSKILGDNGKGIPEQSLFETTLSKYGQQYVMADLFPYESYDESTHLFRNQGSIGFVLETLPLIGASEEMQKEISSLFQYILPEESSLQIILYADPHIGKLCESWQKARQTQTPVLKKLAQQRIDFLNCMAFASPHFPYTLRNFRCFLAFSQADPGKNPVALQALQQLLNQMKTVLEMLRLPVTIWRPEDLIHTLEGMLCMAPPQTSQVIRSWNPYDALRCQISPAESNIWVGSHGLALNNGVVKAKTYKVRQYPEIWSLQAMGRLIGDPERDIAQIPCPFLIHYGVHVPRQDKPQRHVTRKALYVETQAQSPIAQYLPSLQKEAIELNFVRESLSRGERIVQTHFSVVLFAQGDLLTHAEQILRNLFQGQEWRLEANHFLHLPILLSVLPMNWGPRMVQTLNNLKKLKTTLSTESANLLPLQGEWHGTPSPGMILAGRRGQLFTWSPFDSSSNYNVCVVGQSGAGKSVFMQEIVMSLLGTGGRVVVLDVGRSFQKLGQILKGQFIQVTHQESLSLNPFSHLPARKEKAAVEQDTLLMIKQVLTSMIAPSGIISELENSFLEMALDEVIAQKANTAEVTDVAEWFLGHADQRAKDMGTRLYAFTREGVYGRFFTGASTVRFDNRLIVAEFEDIKQIKELSAVILQILIVNILSMMYQSDRKTRFAIIVDEAWEFLAGKSGEALIEAAARQARKYGGVLVVGSQNAEDFHKSLAAKAAFNNSAWKCYLSQSQEAFKAFEKEELITSPSMLSVLRTVRMTPGKYGEALIVSDAGYAIGRLILDPFSQLLYSTKADEFAAIENLMKQGIPVDEAIDQLLKKRKKG